MTDQMLTKYTTSTPPTAETEGDIDTVCRCYQRHAGERGNQKNTGSFRSRTHRLHGRQHQARSLVGLHVSRSSHSIEGIGQGLGGDVAEAKPAYCLDANVPP